MTDGLGARGRHAALSCSKKVLPSSTCRAESVGDTKGWSQSQGLLSNTSPAGPCQECAGRAPVTGEC